MYYSEVFDYIGEDYFYILNRKKLSHAAQELQSIKKTLHLQDGEEILDLCCGIGRLAIPLSKEGFKVTGLDACGGLLEFARLEADDAGLNMEFLEADMRDIPYSRKYDAVLNIWDSFGFLEDDEEHMQVLRSIARSLKPGGRLLLDIPNRDWAVRNLKPGQALREICGLTEVSSCRFDSASGRDFFETTYIRNGEERKFNYSCRLYTLQELNIMLELVGLKLIQAYGGFDFQPVTLNSQRLLLVISKLVS